MEKTGKKMELIPKNSFAPSSCLFLGLPNELSSGLFKLIGFKTNRSFRMCSGLGCLLGDRHEL